MKIGVINLNCSKLVNVCEKVFLRGNSLYKKTFLQCTFVYKMQTNAFYWRSIQGLNNIKLKYLYIKNIISHSI